MSRIKTMTTTLATFSVALGIGFVMQYGEEAVASPANADEEVDRSVVRSIMVSTNAQGDSIFSVPDVVTTPLAHIENVQTVAAVDAVYQEVAVPALGTLLAVPFDDCTTDFTAQPDVAAMVQLSISSPCNADAFFLVRHEGMTFSGQADDDGNAVLQIPALSANASYALSFHNIEEGRVTVAVPDVGLYDRAVLQWYGKHNLQLHALEFGAKIGDPGHIWSASTNSPEQAYAGERGFMVHLGAPEADLPYQAEVYTFPSGRLNRDGSIVLQIGVTITENNCGRELDATTIQTNAGQMLVVEELKIQMPNCGAVGDFMMLRDRFEDLTLASSQ